jgi:hypothetical protein
MKVTTTIWRASTDWSVPLPALDSAETLVLVFGDRMLERERRPLDDLASAFPTSVIVGCSTSGQIAGADLHDDACVVSIARFDRTMLRSARTTVADGAASYTAGTAIGHDLAGDDLRAVFVLSDGLNVNGSDLVRGIAAAVGTNVLVTGGLAGDGDEFERTWIIDRSELRRDFVVAVGLYGHHVVVGSGSEGGWGIFGPERRVTRSSGNVLYELDGKPALELYKRYLGDLADQLPASALLFPLAVRSQSREEQLVRTVLAIDESENSMTFAGDIPEGSHAQLMRSSPNRLVEGAEAAAVAAKLDCSAPTLAVAISCVGRRLVLGARTFEELEATQEVLGEGTELVGFYSYGEIAPHGTGFCDLHNQTMTVTTISEM